MVRHERTIVRSIFLPAVAALVLQGLLALVPGVALVRFGEAALVVAVLAVTCGLSFAVGRRWRRLLAAARTRVER